ncbi:hypothetical protein FPCIR_7662 [Fusarium pseudocircinatum]|uniref:Uncharacterized protein n=1 Tax=Fusarium pseudocircinatum TaxID=56676 RepID=A0A8H5L9C1_9HYPO|nr:hypothetical protein FPCIR_7662 [Fusarium pseudocircinatum]
MSGTTVDNLMALLREQSNFDTEQVTFRGATGMLESIEGERLVQTLADRNGTITFEGKNAEETPDAAVGPSDAVSRNEVGETKLRGRATLHVGDRYAGNAANIPAWLKKGVYNSIKKHDAADDTESHVGNISGL